MSLILKFSDPGSDSKALVGGKGANLGLCARQGFPVPPGFTVTTEAYAAFLADTGLQRTIEDLLAGADYAQMPDLERRMAAIREAIVTMPLPAPLADAIRAGYAELGAEPLVAVRSSGTAEDLAEASFAGMHDTYLHIQGQVGVVHAVQRCWASLWTARAEAYRHQRLIDLTDVRMAVVVQVMVDAEVSGVMFTANPITTATDQLVVNASWGLGEAVVQGFVTPDQYVVKVQRPLSVGFDRLVPPNAKITLRIKSATTGRKELRMVRDPRVGHGTVTEPTPEADQVRNALSEAQVLELAELGRRVQAFYEGLPQDIEWALTGGKLFLLQARPITGVNFDWAADIETVQFAPDDETALFSKRFAERSTGAKSPLYYHWLTDTLAGCYYQLGNMMGIPELAGPAYTSGGLDINRPARHQLLKYHRGEAYINTEFQKAMVTKLFAPWVRTAEISEWISPEQAEEVHAAPFSYMEFAKDYARLQLNQPDAGLFRVLDETQAFIDTAGETANAGELPDLAALSDEELKQRLNEQWLTNARFFSVGNILYVVYAPQMYGLLERMIREWYNGNNADAFVELCQGVDQQSKTLEENLELFEMAQQIRGSAELSALLQQHKNSDFLVALGQSAEGRTLLARYREFVRIHGHRGNEDRDFGYPRRFEDATIDVRFFAMMAGQDNPVSPYALEEEMVARRHAALDEVLRNVRERGGLTSALKAEAIKLVHNWLQRFIVLRDDERWAYEHASLCIKLYCREIGRRAAERGILEDPEDFLMFTKDELFDMLEGRAGIKLSRAKAVARRRDYDRVLNRTHDLPVYLRDGGEVATEMTTEGEGGLTGIGWTSGSVTATARVVNRISDVDRVKPGDILVCASTDPGWTPVFMLLSGIVLETGGVLSHAVCLSREYGLPAVQLPGCRGRIPDGATITINGSTGVITIVGEDDDALVAIGDPADSSIAAQDGAVAS